jgi:hypothetical protein
MGLFFQELASQTYTLGDHSLMIESDKLPQGLYLIEIITGDSKSVLKFVKM